MTRRSMLLLVLLACLTLLAASAGALAQSVPSIVAVSEDSGPRPMPPHPDLLARLRAEGYDSVTVVDLQRVLQARLASGVDVPQPLSAPVLGTRPALVLLADFSDLTHNTVSTPSFYSNLLFSVGTYPAPGSMRDYFREVSNGLFDIAPGAVDSAWRQTGQLHTYYADYDGKAGTADDYGFGTYPRNAQGLVSDVVTLADPYVNFASFASGGVVGGLFVIHAGRGAETDSSRRDWIWSHQWALNAHARIVDGVIVNAYSMEPEYTWTPGDSSMGVFAHEYGHVLGLPDLYDTDGSSDGLGRWSLMAGGSWGGGGASPAHPDAWCKVQLGWVTPTTLTANVLGASIGQVETGGPVYELTNPSLPSTQYFLVENRQQVGFDASLPGSGLCIYHIDEAQWGNTNEWYPGHTSSGNYLVALEQADGFWDLEQGYGSDSGDPYPGSSSNTAFNGSSVPNSRSYADAVTGIAVEAISSSAATMTANLIVADTPLPPSDLIATTMAIGRIDLAWTDNSYNETGFKIERKTGAGGTWAQVATVSADVSTYSNTGLAMGTTYVYRVRASNAQGDSAYSNEASATTYATPVPTNLTATAASASRINLSWTDNASNEDGYRVERLVGSAWSEIGVVGANVSAYQDSGLAENTSYSYRVRAYNVNGTSAYSNVASATTMTLPPAPSGLTATTMATGRIDLAWTDNATTETGFKIERKTGAGGIWAEVATVGSNVTTYSNTGLAMGTTYVYRVCAYSVAGDSAYSNEASATTYATPVPTNLAATAVSNSQINLGWTDNATNEDGYSIERKTGAAGTWGEIATVGANVTTYSDTGLAAGTTYSYRVRGYNANGYSAYSNQASATTAATPAAPSGLTATTMAVGRIDLAWTDNATTETGFRIERKTGAGGTWAQIATVGANVTAYSNTGLAMGTTYVYRVCAYNAAGNSLYSNEASATTYATPVPTNLTATAVSNSQINLSWTDNATNEDGYSIERKTGAAGTWGEIATVGANVTTYSNSGLAAGTTYYYRVRGYNANGYSAYSNQASATTAATPAAPSGLTATTMSVGRIDLAWTDNATTETGFKIERKTGAGGTWAQIATVGANVTTYSNTGLAMGTTYVYRVRAYNAAGDSAYSNEVTAATYAMPVPTKLKATAISSSQIDLAWTDNATNEDGYSIERKTGTTGTWEEIATVGPNVTTYSDTGLAARTTYYYRVRGYNANGYSAYSNQTSALTKS